jgi:PTH1 family peptidyl-tRNA hydrolase
MKVIIGLGNPGKEYELTRHNVGFLMIDGLAKKLDVEVKSHNKAIEGLYYKCDDYILLKPICFMNNSGTCVRSLIDLFKLESFEILLIYDEIFIPLGSIRYGKKCSGGGHNGAKDVI